ncbi:MAG: hypothetical protein ABI823_11005, partial [Bryobacteraceae bacterium]
MSIYQKYELLELKNDDGVKTFLAKQIATQRPVLAHLFVNPHTPEQRALLNLVDALQENERKRIVERGETDGTPFVITDRLIDYPSLRDWLNVNAVPRAKHPAISTVESPSSGPAAQTPLARKGGWRIDGGPQDGPGGDSKKVDDDFAALFDTPAPNPAPGPKQSPAMPPTLANIPIPKFDAPMAAGEQKISSAMPPTLSVPIPKFDPPPAAPERKVSPAMPPTLANIPIPKFDAPMAAGEQKISSAMPPTLSVPIPKFDPPPAAPEKKVSPAMPPTLANIPIPKFDAPMAAGEQKISPAMPPTLSVPIPKFDPPPAAPVEKVSAAMPPTLANIPIPKFDPP